MKDFTNLVQLELGRTKITDTGLLHLKDLTKLEYLGLTYTQVTDAGMANVKPLNSLKELCLNCSNVTHDGYMDMKNALPNCQVYWEKARPIKVGGPAPEISIDHLLQVPEGAKTSWPSLKGKAVVLEFWATWCGPCVIAIPHMNELARKFKGKPIQFIAITAEEESVVKQFLEKHRIEGWIGVDTDRSTASSYGIKGIPDTVLVKDGIIRSITNPRNLTEHKLNQLLNN